MAGTLPPGRIGFNVLSGLRRWNPVISAWEEPVDVPERLRIGFITLETICDDDPVEGFDLAVQSDGGWHRHLDFELLGDGVRQLPRRLRAILARVDDGTDALPVG